MDIQCIEGYGQPDIASIEWPDPETMLVPNVARKSVIFIGRWRGKAFDPLGTAFVVSAETDGYRFGHIVTAAHVVVGQEDPLYMRVNLEGGGYDDIPVHQETWRHHPDPSLSVDIVVAPIEMDRSQIIFSHIPVASFLTDEIIKQLSIGVGDEIFAVGLFTNHIGRGKILPIVRIGNIALMPDEPIETQYSGPTEAYLVEVRSLGGLSGSPVWIHMPPLRIIDGQVTQMRGRQFYFLGIVQGRFNVKAIDHDLVVPEDDKSRQDRINSGIGVVLPAARVREIINHPDLVDARKAVAAHRRVKFGAESQTAGEALVSELSTKDENPQHREDFNSLLHAATKEPKSES